MKLPPWVRTDKPSMLKGTKRYYNVIYHVSSINPGFIRGSAARAAMDAFAYSLPAVQRMPRCRMMRKLASAQVWLSWPDSQQNTRAFP